MPLRIRPIPVASSQGTYLGNFTLTAYCNCAQCCGTAGNLTASGTVPTAGRTVAMAGVPFGTKLLIERHCLYGRGSGNSLRTCGYLLWKPF